MVLKLVGGFSTGVAHNDYTYYGERRKGRAACCSRWVGAG